MGGSEMNKKVFSVLVCLLAVIILAACGPSQAEMDAQATQVAADPIATKIAAAPTPTPTNTPTFTPAPMPTNTPTFTPTPTSTPTAKPTAADIFALVSPSVAFIESPAGRGSGILIEDGYVVTNAHVVWPFQEVRVVFPDGSEHLNAPVLNWDLLGDVAIIGPLQTSVSPVELVDGEDLDIGTDVFLIGYPGEAEQFPQPTFTRGLISRLREWEAIEVTYFQTDALIAGGQSGGVLVSEDGEVIGISGLSFTEAGFGLVASAADVLPRIERLIAGEDIANLGDRYLPFEAGQLEYDFTLHNFWDRRMYVIDEPIGTNIDVEMEGEQDAAFGIIDVFGNVIRFADDGVSGVETGSGTTELAAPYFIIPIQYSEDPGNYQVRSNRRLVPYNDVDDGIRVTIGQTLPASIDYPFDVDYFVIELAEGDTVNITVDSVMIDPFFGIDFLGAADAQIISNDNSGGGLLGYDAKLTYQAPHSGSYFIVVRNAIETSIGGYLLTVDEAPPDATPVSVRPQPMPAPITGPFGPMEVYESTQYPFTIQYPAQWMEQPPEWGQTAGFVSEQGGSLVIAEEDMVAQGFGEMMLEEYTDLFLSIAESNLPDFQLVSREQVVTQEGSVAEVVVFTIQGSFFKGSRFIYLHENRIAFNATYFAPTARHEELESLISYSFDTFKVSEISNSELTPSDPAEKKVDQGIASYNSGNLEQAIQDFTEAIELDPDYALAYFKRAVAFRILGDYEQAIADYDQAIRIDPKESNAYNNRGWCYFNLGDYEQAIADYSHAIEVDPNNSHFTAPYNNRGWVYYLQAHYDQALDDFNRAISLNPSAYALIRRAVVHDTMGHPEKAADDFEQAIENYDGELVEAHNYLAWTLAHDLDTHYEEALEHALRSVELDPQAHNHDTLALVYYKLEQYDKALEHYNITLSLNDKVVSAYKGRGDVYLALGDKEAALVDYEAYLDLVPAGLERNEVEEAVMSLQQP